MALPAAATVPQASLADLNTKLPEPIAMTRFRPNIVVAGMEAWEEDSWRAVDVLSQAGGAVRLLAVKPCSRCTVTTIEQTTGVSGGDEPLDTLRTFRQAAAAGVQVAAGTWCHRSSSAYATSPCPLLGLPRVRLGT